MKKLFAAGALALMTVAGSAQAAPTITFNGGSGTLPTGAGVFQNFDSVAPGSALVGGTNAYAFNTSSFVGARPAYGSTGNFAAVLSGGTYSVAFGPVNLFSFVLGSLDTFNTLRLSFGDGTSMLYTGGQIIGAATTMVDSGSQSDTATNGVVSYTAAPGQQIVGATFASTGNSFEFDNLASGVPEPAAWGMMILGFALVGGALRRRPSASTKVRFA